jgi:DNA-binding NtrC family response regulator
MSQARVLVVDDEIVVCRILERMLSIDHYLVQSSQSVAEALAAIEANPFDLYVVDYKLRDGCGLDFVERIRSKGSDAPVILLSGYDPKEIALRAKDLRIFEILEKPFSREMIFNSVQRALGLKGPSLDIDETHGNGTPATAISPSPWL